MSKFKSDNIIGAGDAVAVREAQNMSEHDRLKGELQSRAEMARAWLKQKNPINYLDYERSLIDLLARRDEMVVEECATEVEEYSPKIIPDRIRSLKGKLR